MNKDIRGLSDLMLLLKDKDFQADINSHRDVKNEYARIARTSLILEKYHLPSTFWAMVEHYVDKNILDETLIGEYVRLETSSKGTVSLVLSHDITQPELLSYIKKHWKTDLKSKLDSYALDRRGRLNAKPLSQSDKDIITDIIAGLSNINIASKHGVDIKTVGRIKSAYKKDKKRVF